ncbi:Ribosomal protein L27 [Phytophthora cactorum]|nr:Ribosomal protein L27 [Phytophthora cactorum]
MAMAMGLARVFGCSAATTARDGASAEGVYTFSRRWASKKAGGSTKNGRDSESKRLGVKNSAARDHTIFATRDGFVRFWYNVPKKRQEVSVKATREVQRAVAKCSA